MPLAMLVIGRGKFQWLNSVISLILIFAFHNLQPTTLPSATTGETGPIINSILLPLTMVPAGLFTIAEYISLEIYLFIFRTFPCHRELYFWSVLCANTGSWLLSLFFLLQFFDLALPGSYLSSLILLGRPTMWAGMGSPAKIPRRILSVWHPGQWQNSNVEIEKTTKCTRLFTTQLHKTYKRDLAAKDAH